MSGKYYIPVFSGFYNIPNGEIIYIERDDVLLIATSDVVIGTSNSAKLEFTLPFAPVDDYNNAVIVMNNGIYDRGILTIEAGSLTAKVFLVNERFFDVSGKKGVCFCIGYKHIKNES